jgi:putative transposase
MPYWRTFYHKVWTTKHRAPLITPDLETVIFPSIAHRTRELGAVVYALNGVADHVHLVTAIPPRLAVAPFIGELKGRSSFIVGTKLNVVFAWQAGYGCIRSARNICPGLSLTSSSRKNITPPRRSITAWKPASKMTTGRGIAGSFMARRIQLASVSTVASAT